MLISAVQQSDGLRYIYVCVYIYAPVCMHTHSFLIFFSIIAHHRIYCSLCYMESFPGGSESKESACSTRDPGLISWSERFPGDGNDHPLQYYYLESSRTEEPDGLQSMGSLRVRTGQRDYLTPCYIVRPCLSILHVIAYICSFQTPSPSVPPSPASLATTNLFSMSVSLFLFRK